jgi:riboflavin synthase alpha subunit
VIEKGADWFAVEASGETLDKTHLGDWQQGQRINLELSLSSATSWAAIWSTAMSTVSAASRR